jgi:hypothetical protein
MSQNNPELGFCTLGCIRPRLTKQRSQMRRAAGHKRFVGQSDLYFNDLMPSTLGTPIVERFK